MAFLPHSKATAEISSAVNSLPAQSRERKSAIPYGAGIFANSILGETFFAFAFFYYVDYLGLAMVSAALVRTIFTFWDVIDDPIMGFLSDRTHSRWGRRRPWLLFAIPLIMLVFIALFAVPDTFREPSRLFMYMLVTMLVYETLGAIIWVNYSSLYPELFKLHLERTRVAVFCQTGNILGVIVALVISPLLFQALGYSKMALVYSLAALALYIFALYFNREGPAAPGRTLAEVLPTLRNILSDRVFWLYALLMTLTLFSTGLSIFALPFYVKYSLNRGSEVISLLAGVALIAALLSMPVWSKLIRTWPLGKVYYLTAFLSCIGMLGMALSPTLMIAAVFFIWFGGTVQGINVLNILIRAGLVSRNTNLTGKQNEASYYGLMNSSIRMIGVLQSLAMLLVGVLFGYVSGDQPGPNPGLAFRFLLGFLGVFSLCLAALVARTFFRAFSTSPTQG